MSTIRAYPWAMASSRSGDLGTAAWRAFHDIRVSLLPPLVKHLSEKCGLTEAEYQVFIGLKSSENGNLKPTEIAEALGWDIGRVSHQGSRMGNKG